MRLRDLIADSFHTLWAHKLRTALTMFGIGWGVVSITLMVAAVEGLRVGQHRQTENLGRNLMIVFSGRTSLQAGGARAGRAVRFGDKDHIEVAREATACEEVLPEVGRGSVPVRSAHNSATLMVTASLPSFQHIRAIAVGEGRFYTNEDDRTARRVAVVGSDARKQLFAGNKALGETIQLGQFPYTIVGLMEFKEQDSSYDGRDVNKIFIPYGAMMRDFPLPPPAPPHTIDRLLVTPKDIEAHEQCKFQVRRALARLHGFDPQDKEAVPVWDTVENALRFRSMTDGMKYFLGAVGIVTLFLGGIGVMNVMLVAVKERTREIGVRKALGATRTSILMQFLLETLIIVSISGGGGLLLAYGLCALVNTVPMPPFFAGLLPTHLLSGISVLLLGLIALFAAMYPANRAASIDPIEALRHEAGG